MPTNKGKLRPYRVDYFDVAEMQGDKALIHYAAVRASTAAGARAKVVPSLGVHRIFVRTFRFYKKLPKEPGYVAVEKLFSDNKAVEIMDSVESFRNSALIPPLNVKEVTLSGPDSPATKAAIVDLRGMEQYDKHEQLMDTFVPNKSSVTPVSSATCPGIGIGDQIAELVPGVVTTDGTHYVNDLGNTPAAQVQQDTLAEQHDTALLTESQSSNLAYWVIGGFSLIIIALFIYQQYFSH